MSERERERERGYVKATVDNGEVSCMKPQLVSLTSFGSQPCIKHIYIISAVDVFFLANQVAQLKSCDFGLQCMITSSNHMTFNQF